MLDFLCFKKIIGNTGIFTRDALVIYPPLGNTVYKLQNHRIITMNLSKFQHTQEIVIMTPIVFGFVFLFYLGFHLGSFPLL